MSIELLESIIIPVIGALLTIVVIPYLREVTTEKQRNKVMFWVETAVMVAEKRFGPDTGRRKKEWVLAFLKQRGIKVKAEELDTIIDAMVEGLYNLGGGTDDDEIPDTE